jgi:hypothetical protein
MNLEPKREAPVMSVRIAIFIENTYMETARVLIWNISA